jgi:hypothetical protein
VVSLSKTERHKKSWLVEQHAMNQILLGESARNMRFAFRGTACSTFMARAARVCLDAMEISWLTQRVLRTADRETLDLAAVVRSDESPQNTTTIA